MYFSAITDNGLRTMMYVYHLCNCFGAVTSFLEFIPHLLEIEGVTSFLSEKLSQDPLEKFFGCQRQRGPEKCIIQYQGTFLFVIPSAIKHCLR